MQYEKALRANFAVYCVVFVFATADVQQTPHMIISLWYHVGTTGLVQPPCLPPIAATSEKSTSRRRGTSTSSPTRAARTDDDRARRDADARGIVARVDAIVACMLNAGAARCEGDDTFVTRELTSARRALEG